MKDNQVKNNIMHQINTYSHNDQCPVQSNSQYHYPVSA